MIWIGGFSLYLSVLIGQAKFSTCLFVSNSTIPSVVVTLMCSTFLVSSTFAFGLSTTPKSTLVILCSYPTPVPGIVCTAYSNSIGISAV